LQILPSPISQRRQHAESLLEILRIIDGFYLRREYWKKIKASFAKNWEIYSQLTLLWDSGCHPLAESKQISFC